MKNINISKKLIIIFLASQVVIFLIVFLLFHFIPVAKESKEVSKIVQERGFISNSKVPKEISSLISTIRITEHHEAYLKNALKLSKIDSISLLIDLRDSLAILSLKGVSIFESKISKIEINKGLKKLPYFLRDSLYSGPLQAVDELSSIEKFPIVVKKPTKDTSTVEKTEEVPTLPKQHDVYVLLALDNSMAIEINQEESELVGTKSALRKYRRQYKRWFFSRNIKSAFSSGQPGYIYNLKIEIPREDAGSIYRALPIKPFILIRY